MPSTNEFNLMLKLVTQIQSRPEAEPFRAAVDWKSLGLFDYPQIIKKPMDLGHIIGRLKKEDYASIHDAAEDVRLVWKNCMQYNADGSDFYKLAQNLSKKFETSYEKLTKQLNLQSPEKVESVDGVAAPAPEPTLEEKRAFAKSLYAITKEGLGEVIISLDNECPKAIIRNSAEDQLEINVDEIDPEAFQKVSAIVKKLVESAAGNNGRKKKSSSSSGKAKKART